MEWLDPWWSTERQDVKFHETFRKQLELELPPGHVLCGVPARLIGRGSGDDALFELLDGTGRVAQVHLTWAKVQTRLPWPTTAVYDSLEGWAEKSMKLEHEEWASG